MPFPEEDKILKRDSMWKVSEGLAALHVKALAIRFLNHDPSERAAIHAINRQQTEAENQEILRQDNDMSIPVLASSC